MEKCISGYSSTPLEVTAGRGKGEKKITSFALSFHVYRFGIDLCLVGTTMMQTCIIALECKDAECEVCDFDL